MNGEEHLFLICLGDFVSDDCQKVASLIPQEMKGPGFHRTPARDGLTKRLKRSFLLLLRGLLGGLLRGLLRGLLLCHHALPPLLKDMDPIGSIGLAGSMWW